MTTARSQIQLNLRGLVELCIADAALTALTIAGWHSLQTHLTMPRGPMYAAILQQPQIIASVAVSVFILIMALLLAIVPQAWWLRTKRVVDQAHRSPETPLQWLGAQIQKTVTPQPPAQPGEPAVPGVEGMPPNADPATLAATQAVATPSADAQPAPRAPATQPIAGAPQPAPAQPALGAVPPEQAGQVAAAQPPSQPGTQPAPPQTPQPQQQQQQQQQQQAANGTATEQAVNADTSKTTLGAVFQIEEIVPEDDPLADLGDIQDILAATFDEDLVLDPDLVALGNALDDIPIQALRTTVRQVQAAFA